MSDLWAQISKELEDLAARSLYRAIRPIHSPQGATAMVEGREVAIFSSNDYLGLANDPRVKSIARGAIELHGAGAGASRLICGSLKIHHELEEMLARLKGEEAALVFPSGYAANLGTLSALLERGDAAFVDRLCHASLIDGIRLSGARLIPFRHNDADHLDHLLTIRAAFRRRLIVTESVFSMDGDLAPLPEVVQVAERHGAAVMVDEAHATGVIGEAATGGVGHFGVRGQVDVVMGTLGKAVGSQGGFICGRRLLVDYLVNRARSFIYSTGINPAAAGAAIAGLNIIVKEPQRRDRLMTNTARLRTGLERLGLPIVPGITPIVPLLARGDQAALGLSGSLFERGFLVPAIRPPTVPKGTSRLRITVTSEHTSEQIDGLLTAVEDRNSELGIRNSGWTENLDFRFRHPPIQNLKSKI